MIIVMKKGARNSEVNAVIKIVGKGKSFISNINGNKIMVVR